jgi:hypothetical protein
MPVSAFGEFTARSADETGFVRGQAVTFTYIPTFFIPWGGGALVLGFLVWVAWKLRRSGKAAPFAVLVPGLVGVGTTILAGMDEYLVFFIAAPLETVTVTLLAWRLVRARNRVAAAMLALVLGFGVVFANMMIDYGRLDQTHFLREFLLPALIIGFLIASPLAGPRLLMKDRRIRKRFILGLGLGFLFSVALLIVVLLIWGESGGAGLVLLLFVPGTLLFSILVKWNHWARDVATGEMFRRGETAPGTELPG